jgi:hypothetical protein
MLPQLRTRQESGRQQGELQCQEVGYDQIPALLLGQMKGQSGTSSPAGESSTSNDMRDWQGRGPSLDSLANEGSATSRNSSRRDVAAGLDLSAAEDPWAWVQRFQELSEGEALQELQVMKYLGGQGALLGPRGGGFLHSRISGPATAANGAGGKKKRQRAGRANAKRR